MFINIGQLKEKFKYSFFIDICTVILWFFVQNVVQKTQQMQYFA